MTESPPLTSTRSPPDATGLRSAARALWTIGPGAAELRSETLTSPGPGDMLVQTLYSGFSRGSERLVFEGRVPSSEYARMRAPFQTGDFPFPVKYGYASVGRVLQGSPELTGRTVFCLHPHQDYYVVPGAAVHPLPPALPPARAVLAANMETALNGIWDGELRAGDRVCVVGAGVVGALVAYLAARHPGCEVCLVDVDARKRPLADALGCSFASPADAPQGCDLVFHASGAADGLRTAFATAGLEARIVELSWYGEGEVGLPLGQAFHALRLSLRSSQVGRVPSAQLPRWSTRRRLALALSLLCDARLDALISGESSFEQAPEALRSLAGDGRLELCHVLRYDPH